MFDKLTGSMEITAPDPILHLRIGRKDGKTAPAASDKQAASSTGSMSIRIRDPELRLRIREGGERRVSVEPSRPAGIAKAPLLQGSMRIVVTDPVMYPSIGRPKAAPQRRIDFKLWSLSAARMVGIAGMALSAGVTIGIPGMELIGLCGVILFALLTLSRFDLFGLAVAYIVADGLVSFLKRAIFLLGAQPKWIYYAVQAMPLIIYAALLFETMRCIKLKGIPWSGRLFGAFFLLATGLTLWSLPNSESITSSLASVNNYLLPLPLFFVGLALPMGRYPKLATVIAVIASLSVIYGLIQFIGGPTYLDRIWAMNTSDYSIHGEKVFLYIEGIERAGEWRAFSFYADPLTWGLFLFAGFICGMQARAMSAVSGSVWRVIQVLILAGLVISMTRTPLIGLLAAFGMYILMRYPLFRNAWVVAGLTAGCFVVLIWGGNWFFENFTFSKIYSDSEILRRYTTMGTLRARMDALDYLKDLTSMNWLIGKGFGFSHAYEAYLPETTLQKAALALSKSHNFLVTLIIYTGLPGLALFIVFYVRWLKEGMRLLKTVKRRSIHTVVRWTMAFSFGSILAGYLNGINFMTPQFFLLLGVMSGYYMREVKMYRLKAAHGS